MTASVTCSWDSLVLGTPMCSSAPSCSSSPAHLLSLSLGVGENHYIILCFVINLTFILRNANKKRSQCVVWATSPSFSHTPHTCFLQHRSHPGRWLWEQTHSFDALRFFFMINLRPDLLRPDVLHETLWDLMWITDTHTHTFITIHHSSSQCITIFHW